MRAAARSWRSAGCPRTRPSCTSSPPNTASPRSASARSSRAHSASFARWSPPEDRAAARARLARAARPGYRWPHAQRDRLARRVRRKPPEPHEQTPALDLRAAHRALGDGVFVVGTGSVGVRRCLPVAQLGDARRGGRCRLLPRALAGARGRGAARFRGAALDDALARKAALAAVADLARDLRRRLDRAVRRPCDRGRATVLLQGPAVPPDRSAVAARCSVPPLQPAVLTDQEE